MSTNMDFARALIAHLAANGVRHFVLCPGSRSGPLAHALAEATQESPPEGAPDIELHVRIDERSAGFLALGLSKMSGPVAIVTTSGTAVGNLLPAVMEASHGGHPLIVLSADRPTELRGTGANQTTHQPGIFGDFVRYEADVPIPLERDDVGALAFSLVNESIAAALPYTHGSVPTSRGLGPVHLNLQLREPLDFASGPWPDGAKCVLTEPNDEVAPPIPDVARGVVVAGDDVSFFAAELAEARGWPLLAEPSSGARRGPNVIDGYVELLRSEEGASLLAQVEFVVCIGRPTLSREIQGVLNNAPRLWTLNFGAHWQEAPAHAEHVAPILRPYWTDEAMGVDERRIDISWLKSWQAHSAASEAPTWDSQSVASALLNASPRGAIVAGSSRSIRALDAVMTSQHTEDCTTVVANRGLAGIDGTVATAIGYALASDLDGDINALMGDLTFLHDIGGLLIGPRERTPNLRIVVVNDGGGTIFSGLEHASAPAANFERVFTTPHGANLGDLVRGYGHGHTQVRSLSELEDALAAPRDGIDVVECMMEGS